MARVGGSAGAAISGGGCRQDQVDAVDEEAQVGLGFGDAGENELAPVCCGYVHIDNCTAANFASTLGR